jgi:2-polyprenyl-6-methoxyphenol hydroxylase-like FAD-dependent oxidoreductase
VRPEARDRGIRVAAGDLELDMRWKDVGGCAAIHQAALHEALRGSSADAEIRLGISVPELHDTGQTTSVRFSDGSTGDYELVVGADGVHSSIRTLAFGGPPARYVGQASWRFVASGFPEISDWTVMLGRGRAFLTVALGNGTVYCYADVNTKDPAEARVAERRKCSRTR